MDTDLFVRKEVATERELYITKLISLFLFRLALDDSVEEFEVSNMDDGDESELGHVCIKVNITGLERPVYVFLETLHGQDHTTFLPYLYFIRLNEVNDSFPQISNEEFENCECLFIYYTTARFITNKIKLKPYHSSYAEPLNNLIATGGDNRQGYQVECTEEVLETEHAEYLEQEIRMLAEDFMSFLFEPRRQQSISLVKDRRIVLYHVLLAQKVVHISDIRGSKRHRELTFRSDFFMTDDKNVLTLRNNICYTYFYDYNLGLDLTYCYSLPSYTSDCVEKQISEFLSYPSATTLSPLMGIYIVHDKFKELKFRVERPSSDREILNKINTTHNSISLMIEEAIIIAVKNKLMSQKFKVPEKFGNIDIVLPRDYISKNRKVDQLAKYIVKLCQTSFKSNHLYIVTTYAIDGFSIDDIRSVVGNLLVHDNTTKLLKFTENVEALQDNARAVYDKLKRSSIGDTLNSYRFDAKSVKRLPKLEFDCTEDIKADLKKVVIYENQSNHDEVENIIKEEIERQQFTDEQNVPVPSDKIFLYCHSAVQQWWMTFAPPRLSKRLLHDFSSFGAVR